MNLNEGCLCRAKEVNEMRLVAHSSFCFLSSGGLTFRTKQCSQSSDIKMCWCCLLLCSHLLTNGNTGALLMLSLLSTWALLILLLPSLSSLSPTLKGLHEFQCDSILLPEPLGLFIFPPLFSPSRARKSHFLCLSRSAGHLQVSLRRFISFLPLSTAL